MVIQVNTNYVSIVSKINKLATGDVKYFRGQLDRIRVGLSAAYKGNEDISAEITVLEKKLDDFSTKLSSMSNALNQGASAIIEKANRAINIGELAPLSKELEFVLSNPTTAQMINRNNQILLAQSFTENFKNNSFLTSMFGKGLVGGLFTGASTFALLPLLNTDNSQEGVDNWYKEHYPEEYEAAQAETRRMQNVKNYDELEEMYKSGTKVEILDNGNRYYVSTTDGKGRYFNKSGGCTYFAAARFEKVNGEGSLVMKPGVSANGGDWHKAVAPEHFNISETKDNLSAIQPNTLATTWSNGYGKASKNNPGCGHVVYIEGVAEAPNGKTYVYFSQGSSYKNYQVDKMEINKFAGIYGHIISQK